MIVSGDIRENKYRIPVQKCRRRTAMAPLSSKGTETKYRIIRTAAELFHKQGLHATSPDDIIEASETGKGQFYHYFKSKEGLVHEVLLWHLDAIRSGTSPIKYDISSWRDLEAWLYSHIEFQKSFGMTRGCPFGTAANDNGRRGTDSPRSRSDL
jgi:TetR/AcrR family transcriptional regulator, transcriptional repressor for nem operon